MEDKILTAEELLENKYQLLLQETQPGQLYPKYYPDYCKSAMIEFAKLHVKAALEAACNQAWVNSKCQKCNEYHGKSINKDSILNAYPEKNIK